LGIDAVFSRSGFVILAGTPESGLIAARSRLLPNRYQADALRYENMTLTSNQPSAWLFL